MSYISKLLYTYIVIKYIFGDFLMKKVLFVCTQNSARRQMSAAFLNRLGEGHFIAESAGLESGTKSIGSRSHGGGWI